jgi:hypothetical protein
MCYLSCEYFENDEARRIFNHWDFSPEGRIIAAHNMLQLINKSTAKIKLVDMICPTKESRAIICPDIIVYIDSPLEGKYDNSIYEIPSQDECEILLTAKYDKHQEVVNQLIEVL